MNSPKVPNNVPYVVAVFIMLFIAFVFSFVVILVRPDQDNTGIIVAVFGFLTPTTFSLLSFMKSQETHIQVNGRMTEFVEMVKKSSQDDSVIARAEGVVQGTDEANKRTDRISSQSK